jgi:hypothetical protein
MVEGQVPRAFPLLILNRHWWRLLLAYHGQASRVALGGRRSKLIIRLSQTNPLHPPLVRASDKRMLPPKSTILLPMLISSVQKPHDALLCGYGNVQKQASGYCVMQETTLPRIWHIWPA